MDNTGDVSAYEMERLARIAANAAELVRLGLHEGLEGPAVRPAVRQKRPRKTPPLEATRKQPPRNVKDGSWSGEGPWLGHIVVTEDNKDERIITAYSESGANNKKGPLWRVTNIYDLRDQRELVWEAVATGIYRHQCRISTSRHLNRVRETFTSDVAMAWCEQRESIFGSDEHSGQLQRFLNFEHVLEREDHMSSDGEDGEEDVESDHEDSDDTGSDDEDSDDTGSDHEHSDDTGSDDEDSDDTGSDHEVVDILHRPRSKMQKNVRNLVQEGGDEELVRDRAMQELLDSNKNNWPEMSAGMPFKELGAKQRKALEELFKYALVKHGNTSCLGNNSSAAKGGKMLACFICDGCFGKMSDFLSADARDRAVTWWMTSNGCSKKYAMDATTSFTAFIPILKANKVFVFNATGYETLVANNLNPPSRSPSPSPL
jgi:hypothetical protein